MKAITKLTRLAGAAVALAMLLAPLTARSETQYPPPPPPPPPPANPPPPPSQVAPPPTPGTYYPRGYQSYYNRPNPAYAFRGYLGFSGVGTGVISQSGGAELLGNGGGVSIWGGLRFGPVFALELNYTGSFHNPALGCLGTRFGTFCAANYLVLDTFGIDAKLHIPTDTIFDPYFQGGLALAWLGREGFAADAKGGGFDLGGGFDVWLSPWVTLGIRVLYRGIKMNDFAFSTGTDTFLSLATGELNMAVHF